MSVNNSAATEKKRNLVESFVAGARVGLNMCLTNMAPNVIFAFAMINIVRMSGFAEIIGTVCGPVMGIFGLPGIAATAVVAGILSMGGGVGATASLVLSGDITHANSTVLLVGIAVFGSAVQYMGRVLGTAGAQSKYYPVLFIANIGSGLMAMFVANIFI